MITGFQQTVTWRLAELEGRLAEGRPAASDPALVEALAVEAAALVSDFPAKDRAALPRRIEAARARIEELAPAPAYRLGEIVTGDARQLAPSIADGSVDLVFCDPVYQNLDDYAWLAEQSLRVLRPRGVCLAWASVPKAGRAQQAMEDAGLEYVYTLFYTVVAKTYRMRWYNLFCWTTPCLWFQRPGEATRPNRWMPDTFQETVILPPEVLDNTVSASANPDDPFAWNKNTGVLKRWLERFSKPGEVVWDPFAGSGSVPVAARITGRRFFASELVADRAEEARARLLATPEPMILAPAASQAAFSLEEAA
jgi:adenine-specific DNA-methyltransferase